MQGITLPEPPGTKIQLMPWLEKEREEEPSSRNGSGLYVMHSHLYNLFTKYGCLCLKTKAIIFRFIKNLQLFFSERDNHSRSLFAMKNISI